jgi:hypothetical protein
MTQNNEEGFTMAKNSYSFTIIRQKDTLAVLVAIEFVDHSS